MAKGRFRLARVAKLNEQLRREKEREVKSTLASIQEVQARAELAERAREESRGQEQAQALRDACELRLFRLFDARLIDEELRLKRAADELEARLAEGRAELVARRREEKKFEQLESFHESRAREEQERESCFEMDEMALASHTRRRRAEQEG